MRSERSVTISPAPGPSVSIRAIWCALWFASFGSFLGMIMIPLWHSGRGDARGHGGCQSGSKFKLSHYHLAGQVERTARGLAGLGLAPGDRVGVWATNCAEWIYLQLGCARAGLVMVSVNPAYRARELSYVLKKSGMKALALRACDPRCDYKSIVEEAARRQTLPLRHLLYFGEESWDRMLAGGCDAGPGPTNCEDVVNIQYTSGTTGSPKGVLLTHRNPAKSR